MKIVAFLQLYNELEKGNLIRCLDNCKKWSDHIVIYDDNSTDGSQDVYLNYTDKDLILAGNQNDFKNELFHKQELLKVALKLNPDWIGWMDGDAIFNRNTTENLKNMCEQMSAQGIDGAQLHYLNLWKSESWYRRDSQFNDLWTCALWRNNGNLHYNPVGSLHQQQFPSGIQRLVRINEEIIHYGFSSRDKIIEKYLRYKEHGQTGWALERLLHEGSDYSLFKVNKMQYPEENIPLDHDRAEYPIPERYEEIRKLNSFKEYKHGA